MSEKVTVYWLTDGGPSAWDVFTDVDSVRIEQGSLHLRVEGGARAYNFAPGYWTRTKHEAE